MIAYVTSRLPQSLIVCVDDAHLSTNTCQLLAELETKIVCLQSKSCLLPYKPIKRHRFYFEGKHSMLPEALVGEVKVVVFEKMVFYCSLTYVTSLIKLL